MNILPDCNLSSFVFVLCVLLLNVKILFHDGASSAMTAILIDISIASE